MHASPPCPPPPDARARSRRGAAAGLCLLAGLLAGLPAAGQDPAGAPEEAGVAYTVALEGLDPAYEALAEALRAASLAIALQDEPPRTRAGLARRAEGDVERFGRVLRSQGYYDGTVTVRLGEAAPGEPVALAFGVEPGPLYVIERVLIAEGDGPAREAGPERLRALGLWIGQPARAQTVIDAENALPRAYRIDGHPFATRPTRRAEIAPARETMTVTYRLDPGPRAVFGAIRIDGAPGVEPAFLRRHAAWEPGAPYDVRLVEETRLALTRTGLFDTVALDPVPGDDPGVADIRLSVAERPARSIGFGAGYATDIGPRIEVFWEHRNAFSGGERLRLELEASDVERGHDGSYRQPFFRRDDQSLVAEWALKDVTSEAFDERRASALVGVERRLSETWTATVGPTLDIIDQDAQDSAEDGLVLAGLRAALRHDGTDDPLDPTRGGRIDLALEPYAGFAGSDADFLSASAAASHYLKIDRDGDFVLAGRARVGVLLGEERSEIPAGKRFYAGGGGSVRGYGFQELGPLDGDGDPVGGRSVVEVGLEARARLGERIGLVPFLEAGTVHDEEIPPADALDPRWAAGLGLRYYTDFGPIRLDVAIPLDQRDGIDDDYQVYVSLGQAF